MLTTPDAGWTTIKIGDWQDICSYLCDPAHELLEAVDYTLLTGNKTICEFDAEGYNYMMIISDSDVYIITEKDDISITQQSIEISDLAKELISDIRKDIEKWVHWQPDEDEKYYSNERNYILTMCDAIEEIIENKYEEIEEVLI